MKANIPVYRRAYVWWAVLLAVLAVLCVLLLLFLQARNRPTEQRFAMRAITTCFASSCWTN